MLLMIDNYDSFTYNLVQYFAELGEAVKVFRNDQITLSQIESLAPDYIVISPGPCTPEKAGISVEVVDRFKGEIPLLGVCLGHQSIAQALGGSIVHAERLMHGKTSKIYHSGNDVFTQIESPFTATRYHSLVVEKETLPDCFEITAWTQGEEDEIGEIMGLAHKQLKLFGVQFHPESILTSFGHDLLNNFLRQNSR